MDTQVKFNNKAKLLISLTVANLKSRYRNTLLGFLWVILNPILTYMAQVFAFSMIFRMNIPNYPLYLLGGLLPWLFIVQSIDMCTGIFLYNSFILKNIPIPPIFLPLAQLIDNFINFLAAFCALLTYFLLIGELSLLNVMLLCLPTLSLLITMASLTSALAILNIKYKDLKFVVSFLLTLLFFFTPIFYSINILSENLKMIITKNPFFLLIRPFQDLLTNASFEEFSHHLALSFLVTGFCLIFSIIIWQKTKRNITLYA